MPETWNPWVEKIPWRRAWQPTPVFLPGESHGQRNLVGCRPWGRRELDTTETKCSPAHSGSKAKSGSHPSFWLPCDKLSLAWTKHLTLVNLSFSSVAQSCLTLRPHEPQHTRPPCPSPTPGVYSNSCPSSRWCHPAISSSVVPFSSCPQSLPASGTFPMSQLFALGGQSIGVLASASVLPMNTQDWLDLILFLVFKV